MEIKIKTSVILCFLLFQNIYPQQITTEKEIINNRSYKLHYLNEDLERFKTEVYVDETMIEFYSFDPSTQYTKEYYDGINYIVFDGNHTTTSKNLTIDMTEKLKWLRSGYDEIIINGLSMVDFNYSGNAKIYGLKYKREYSYDPISTYLTSSILGYKAPQYASYILKDLPLEKTDLIGEFDIKNGKYIGTGYLEISSIKKRFEFEFQEGVLLKFNEIEKGEIINEFDISKKFFKSSGQVYTMPDISVDNHSFKKYVEAYEKYNGNQTGMKRFMYFPFMDVDPLNGKFHLSNQEIKKDNIFRLLYYSKSGVVLTLMPAGNITIQNDGPWTVENYESTNIRQNLPKYYFSIKPPNIFERPEQKEIEKSILIDDILSLSTLGWGPESSDTYNIYYTYNTPITRKLGLGGGDPIGNTLALLNIHNIRYNPHSFSKKIDGKKGEIMSLVNFGRSKIARVDWLKKRLFSEKYLANHFEFKFSIPNPDEINYYDYKRLKEVEETGLELSEFIETYKKNEQDSLVKFVRKDREDKVNSYLEYLSKVELEQKKIEKEKREIQEQKRRHESLMEEDYKYRYNFIIQENTEKIDSLEGLTPKTKEIISKIKELNKYNKKLKKILKKL